MMTLCVCFSGEDLETNSCVYLQLHLLMSQPDTHCYHMMLQVNSSLLHAMLEQNLH